MKEQIPNITKTGVPIETANPYPEIRKNAETAPDWEYKDEARYLYDKAVLFKDRFLDPVLLTDRRRLPDPVISFNNLRNKNTLAAYTLFRNPQGLLLDFGLLLLYLLCINRLSSFFLVLVMPLHSIIKILNHDYQIVGFRTCRIASSPNLSGATS